MVYRFVIHTRRRTTTVYPCVARPLTQDHRIHNTHLTHANPQAVPRAIDAALSKAGATRLTEFASGDADSTMEESFEEWKFALWEGLSKHLGICE